jgi:hypothetical protein
MKWLRKLFGTRELPPTQWESEVPEPIDWSKVEEKLLRLSEEQISLLAKRSAGEVFYGLGFDCSSESGEVLICGNTDAHLAAVAAEAVRKSPQYYVGKTPPEVEEELRWQFGEWKFHGFNLDDPNWAEEWGDVEEEISNSTNILVNSRKWPEFTAAKEEFMRMATRALIRLKKSRSTTELERARGFSVLCAEHNEGPEEGFKRMSSVGDT